MRDLDMRRDGWGEGRDACLNEDCCLLAIEMQCSFEGLGHRNLHFIYKLTGGKVPEVQEVVRQDRRLPQRKDTRWGRSNWSCVSSIGIPQALVVPKPSYE